MAESVYKVVELIGTSIRGEKVILVPSTTVVRAGQTYKYPPEGNIVQPELGKELITLFASDQPFPGGEVLRGEGVAACCLEIEEFILGGVATRLSAILAASACLPARARHHPRWFSASIRAACPGRYFRCATARRRR